MGPLLTVGQAIREHAALQPDQTAILTSHFAPLSYRDLQLQLDEIRINLRQGGLTSSARIGVLLPNGPEAVLTIVAAACSAVAVPLDPRQTPAELNRNLEALRLDALIVPRGSILEGWSSVEHRSLTIVEAAPVEDGRLGLILKTPASSCPAPDSEPLPDAPAFILQTSGTTAQPKLIPFSHANMLAAAARLKDWFGLTPSDRCLSVSTPFYSHGLKVTVFTPLLTGGSIAIPANPGMVDLREWFHALQPTWYSAAPTLHRAVLDKARASAGLSAKHRLRFVISGGAALPQAVREGLQATLVVPVLEHYGSSEAAQIAANLPPPGPSKPGTCGMPWPGTVMIVDEDGSPVHPGDQGEVWVRGPTVMPGYLNDQDSNRRSFVDSWLRTGDLGSLDADGFLSLHGRLNEVINRGGEKISPGEIDGALLRHPAVAEAAAFALPHSRLGEDVAAAVVLHPGATATSADLRQFLQGGLAPFKIPRRIRILDQLPKGMTGKVQRRRLAEVFSATTSHATTPHAPFLEAELLQLWRHLLGSERLTIDDDFFESGGDSLLATEMLLEVERLIGHRVSETIMFKAATVRQVALQLTAQPAPQTCVHSYGSGDQRPLFFFHGDFDNGAVQIRQLVRLLGPDQPIVTIDPHGLRGEPIPPSFEEMAADRLQLILQKQASGPFMLGGKCNGAMVAFETARLLRAAGHKVDMVVMVDPPTVCARPIMRMILRLMRPAVSPLRLGWVHGRMARAERLLSTSPIQILTNAYHHLVSKGFEPPSPSPPWEGYMHAMSRYLPAPLDVPVVFYAATHNGRPWRRISSNLEVVEVPGGHDHCLTIGAETVATHLRQRIACLTS